MPIRYQLKDSQGPEVYKMIADNTYDWEYFISVDGESIYHSPSCERITGYKAKEFILDNKKQLDIIYPEDRIIYNEHIRNETSPDQTEGLEFRIIDSSGQVKWIEHRCSVVYDVNGECLGIRGSNREITNRKKLEHEIHHRELKYKNLIEHSPYGIGITQGTEIIYANKPLLDIHGVSSLEELKSKSLIERIHPIDRAKVNLQLEKIKQGKIQFPFSFEHRIIRKDGQVRILHLQVSHYKEGENHYLQSFITDITEQEKISKARKKILNEYLLTRKKNSFKKEIIELLDQYFIKYKFENIDKLKIRKTFDVIDNHERSWKNIKLHFEKIHENYYQTLKKYHGNLTASDLRLCAYIKLKLTTKEIADLTNVKPTSVQRSRVRLKKKLGLGKEKNLFDYLDII